MFWGSCLSGLFWVSAVFGSVVPEQSQNRRGRRALWENNGKERKKESWWTTKEDESVQEETRCERYIHAL